jgi:methylenetetrahydrofolate reductase (NADPH)
MKSQRLADVYRGGNFGLSIEIFPPKTEQGEDALRRVLRTLTAHRPAFVSCTYGAGGSTQAKTIEWCREVQANLHTTAMAHLTCVGSTREELLDWLRRAEAAGVTNVMALRGDPPAGQESFQAVQGGLSHANELVELIRGHHPAMGIGVAGYPETHQEAPDAATDLRNLKRKVDAGADAVFTQLFFENQDFLRFRDRCERAGIRVPVVPGVMPITEYARIQRITAMCGSRVPAALATRLEAARDDKAAQYRIGVEHAVGQCRRLLAEGVSGLHLYSLNRDDACLELLNALGRNQRAAA